ncbi:unnamed protein product, partial [marine sediment metagenome]
MSLSKMDLTGVDGGCGERLPLSFPFMLACLPYPLEV